MGAESKIEWTHHTFNPWRGCTKVSAGCKHCYAETMSGRNPAVLGVWGPKGTRVVAAESYWRQPLKWNAAAAAAGERHRVFCASLADVFEGVDTMPRSEFPKVDTARERLWELIEQTPNLDWLLLTKRPENVNWFVPTAWIVSGFPPNVWIGTSVEDQAAADERIPHLLKVPARVRFLSCEPLLGPVDLEQAGAIESAGPAWAGYNAHIEWAIVGGESGGNARPMVNRWARSLRDQCVAASVPFFFKQHGEWIGMADYDPFVHGRFERYEERALWATYEGDPNDLPNLHYRVGKKLAGRLLDDRTWDEVPE